MPLSKNGAKGPQRANSLRILWGRLKEHPLSRVGPGLITGVADDDPSGIATYSQAGAQFGLNMLWTMPLAFPLMAAIQSMCALIGRVTGKGLAANIKATFPPIVLQCVILLLLLANTLNIAADVAAMGEVSELVTGFDRHLMTAFFVVGTLLLQVFVPYHRYVFFLKWLTLSLLAYAAVLFTVHVPWGEVALRTFWPNFTLDSEAATVVVGVFGTTISPYLFFWQASEEVEDMRGGKRAAPLVRNARAAGPELRRIRWDTWTGMFYSNATAYFIILATAVTLNVADNWQTSSNIVLGIEGDIQASGQSNTTNGTLFGAAYSETDKITYFGTIRGRLGYAIDRWMPYVTGGWGYGEFTPDATITGLGTFSSSNSHGAWVVGGGVDAALVGNWTAKVEYLYLDTGDITNTYATGLGTLTTTSSVKDNIIRAGLNYRF
jgi:Mn2+/Fe2+ NRAMP family transporter